MYYDTLDTSRLGGYSFPMALVVIPARWASTRLAAKPLADIEGRPMVEHVWSRARTASGVTGVVVATDHDKIVAAVKNFGGDVLFTGECKTGTDRVAMVAREMPDAEIIVNLQGDEPLIPPEMIEEVIAPFKTDPNVKMASLKRAFRPGEDPSDPDIVKVVTDLNEDAIYFSRSRIPFPRNEGNYGPYVHVGLYAFRRETLLEFTMMDQTPLEKAESLEQLRALENGIKIRVPTTGHFSVGVDTAEDLETVRKIIKNGKKQ